MIYTNSEFRNPQKIKPYPNIKSHLDKFQKVITTDFKPYGIHRTRDENFFKGEKIISMRKCSTPSFAYVDFDSYVNQVYYVIKTKRVNMKYLTGLLNSKLTSFWLFYKGKLQGNQFQVDKIPLKEIPIKKIPEEKQTPFINLVDQILSITKDNDYLDKPDKQAKVKRLEEEIDKLVYELYELTPEEIEIVEEFNKGK